MENRERLNSFARSWSMALRIQVKTLITYLLITYEQLNKIVLI